MPTYLDPLNGLTISEAYAEAAAYAAITDVKLNTFELWHPSMSAPVRIVMNDEPVSATLEDDAPRNPGEDVVFIASRVTHKIPEENDEAQSQSVSLQVDNVSNYIAEALRVAREHPNVEVRQTPWELIERVFMASDLTAPHILPVFKVTLIDVTMSGASAILKAANKDSANTSIPAITFTPEYYSGLLS